MDHRIFEIGLALVLVAGAALLSARLRFSVVPFLILAGMAVGTHAPKIGIFDFRFTHSTDTIQMMGRMGVLFLLFYLGLEFSVSRLVSAGRSILAGGTIYIGINFTIGLLFAASLGWPLREVLVAAGITTISSSAIVAKMLIDLRRTASPETELILGITMFEDIFLAVYLSIVSGLVLSGATSLGGVLSSAGIALGFMVVVVASGRIAAPMLDKALRIASDEVFILVLFASLFFFAGFAETIHVAEAIGALLLGLVLAETEHAHRMERLVLPFRDFFGAVFFFSFGLTIDPRTLGGAVGPALIAVVLTVAGNVTAGLLAGRASGNSREASLTVGLTLTSRGEFAIILSNLAKAGGLLPILQPFAALYVLILAILGPLLTKESEWIYRLASRLRLGRRKALRAEGEAGATSEGKED